MKGLAFTIIRKKEINLIETKIYLKQKQIK